MPERVNPVAVGGGVSATVGAVSPASIAVLDPTASYADSRGMVAMPNVDFASEIVQQLMAQISFAANIKVLKADAQMTSALLDIRA